MTPEVAGAAEAEVEALEVVAEVLEQRQLQQILQILKHQGKEHAQRIGNVLIGMVDV